MAPASARRSAPPRPMSTEVITYNMPGLKRNGRFLVSYDAFERHYSLFPSSDPIVEALGDRIRPFLAGKGTIRFPADKPLPLDLVTEIVKIRRRRERRGDAGPALASPDPRRTIRAMSAPADPAIVVENIDVPGAAEILTPDALAFVADLQRRFSPERISLLEARHERQKALDAGDLPDFLAETADVRAADWRVAPAPADLDDRRVEITGPAEPKMMINALNSRRPRLHGRLRGRAQPDVGERRRRPGGAPRRGPPRADVRLARGQGLPPERRHRHAARPAARLAPRRAPRARRRRPDLGLPVRLRAVLLPQRRRAARARQRARTSTCPSSRATSRRGSGTTSSSTPRTRSASRAARSARRC